MPVAFRRCHFVRSEKLAFELANDSLLCFCSVCGHHVASVCLAEKCQCCTVERVSKEDFDMLHRKVELFRRYLLEHQCGVLSVREINRKWCDVFGEVTTPLCVEVKR